MADIRNITGRDYCAACGDDGWVDLAGTTTINGTTYTRGMAPCKWCEQGTRRFNHALNPPKGGRRWIPEDRFDGSDINPAGDPPERVRPFKPNTTFLRERAEAGISIGALQAMFPRTMWPPEWTPVPPKPNPLTEHEDDETIEKQRKAQIALETASQEPSTGDEPESRDQQHPPTEAEEVPY